MPEPVSKNILIAKARGFTTSIQRMDEKQKSRVPSGEYGEDYNRLRNQVQQQYPQIAGLLPPEVDFFEGADSQLTRQCYSEIDTFCEQLTSILLSLNGER